MTRETHAHAGAAGLGPVHPTHRHAEALRRLPEHHVVRNRTLLEEERAGLPVVQNSLLDRAPREAGRILRDQEDAEAAILCTRDYLDDLGEGRVSYQVFVPS